MRIPATPLFIALLWLTPPAGAQTPGLTVKTGETWTFSLFRGEPVRARKSVPDAKPGPGQVTVTVRSMMGTSMTIVNNSDLSYTYQAELIGAGKGVPARSCALPAHGRLSFEHWPEKASAVRLSHFRITRKDGNCP